jgi:hypothetical protein
VDSGFGRDQDNETMTFTDYLIDISLLAVVLWQIRGRALTTRSLLLPLGLGGWAAATYLRAVPTAGNDLVLIVSCAVVGALLGALAARFTSLARREDGVVVAKAGPVAAGLWVIGVGTRFAFQLYATHGGGAAVLRFSAHHDITSTSAWTAALVLMALGEVFVRSGLLAWRGQSARGSLAVPAHVAG